MPAFRVDIAPPLATIVLDRPPLNILTIAMMEEGLEAIRRTDWRGVRAAILRGEGKCFSAGVDVGEHLGKTCRPMLERFHALFRALLHLPCALVARVHGACLGGGAELLLACDAVVAAEDAQIGFPEIRLGVFPPLACAFLGRAVGATRARRMILTGEPVSGREAAAIGLATLAATAAGLEAAAAGEAALLARHSAAALRETRRALAEFDLARVEEIYHAGVMRTADATEGLTAFLEKRPPRWSDR
jgi:cyclohexa-1,5-dienecarbonyl-CoA hydratase